MLPSLATGQMRTPEGQGKWSKCIGVHAGSPTIVSATVGVSRLVHWVPEGWTDVFVVAEPGINAGRVSIGSGRFRGNLASGYTVRASALRRWRGTPADYAGAEVSVHRLLLGPRIGVFRQIRGVRNETLLTIDFGFGY
jgi:hypothetical protein